MHQWECCKCGNLIMFRQPEKDGWMSEKNDNKTCPGCGGDMYWDAAPDVSGGSDHETEAPGTGGSDYE